MAGKTLYDKLWEAHEVKRRDDGSSLIYIDRHIIHEVTSPQAFEGLRLANRKPWRIDTNIATPDHNGGAPRRSDSGCPTPSAQAGNTGQWSSIRPPRTTTRSPNCNITASLWVGRKNT